MPDTPYVYRLTAARTLEAQPDAAAQAAPEPGQVTLRSIASAVSPGTELAAWGALPPLRPTANPYPRLMGYCMVAEITAVGTDVSGWTPGDRVLTHSAHRSHDRVAAGEILCPLPEGSAPDSVSTTYLFHLGYDACLKAGVTAGQSVAVIGLGTLGMTVGAVAQMSGAEVTGFSGHTALADAAAFGIGAVRPKDLEAADAAFDVVVLTTNPWSDWRLALRLARRGGTIVMLGFPGRGEPAPDFNPLASQYIYDKQLTLTACGYTPDLDVTPQELRFTLKRNMSFLSRAVASGRLPGEALISDRMPGSDLAKAYQQLEERRSGAGTIVLDWTIEGASL